MHHAPTHPAPTAPPTVVVGMPAAASRTANDEEYARMVQAQIEQEERAAAVAGATTPSRNSPAAPPCNPKFMDVFHERVLHERSSDKSLSVASTEPSTDDEAVARRIQQELSDAELAQRLSRQEQQEFASQDLVRSLEREAQLQQQERPPRRKRSCIASFLPLAVCVAIAITLPLLFVFDVFDSSDIPFFGDLFGDDWVDGDPWSGTNQTIIEIGGIPVPELPDRPMGWNNKGNGLELEILNACNDEYQPFVETAVANWDNGYPIDSLTLYITRIPYENECKSVTGKLKICNGDYGDTRWRGLNEVLLSPRWNTIVSSTALLNEYYLNYESDFQKLYTTCHELGHGFGLPHWDENFFNADLGNCMDYTQNPKTSYKPDTSNFLYLAQLYGGLEVPTDDDDAAALMAMEYIDGGYGGDYDGNYDAGYRQDDGHRYAVKGWKDYHKKEDKDDRAGTRKLGRTVRSGRRHHRGLSSPSSSSPQDEYSEQSNSHHDIPLRHSRVLDEDGILLLGDEEHSSRRSPKIRNRRILHADESREVHVYPSTEYPGLIVMQHFLLVEPE